MTAFFVAMSLAFSSTLLGGDDWVVSFSAYGPVKIEMIAKEAEKALGVELNEDLPTETEGGPPVDRNECHYASNDKKLSGLAFMLVDERIVRIGVYEKPYRTVSGAVVGMTEKSLKDLYPKHKVQPRPYNEEGHYVVVNENTGKYSLIFETDGKTVTSFRAGEYGPVQWIEGCS